MNAGVLSVLLLLPNVLWVVWSARSAPPERVHPLPRWTQVVRPIEHALRAAVFTLPFFLSVDTSTPGARPAWRLAALSLVVYYAAWIRFFAGGRAPSLLLRPWYGLPVPLAIAPVLYLVATAVLTRSVLLGVVAVVFGAVHITMSVMRSTQ